MKIFGMTAVLFAGTLFFVAGCMSDKIGTSQDERVFLTNENAINVIPSEKFFRDVKPRVFPHRIAVEYRGDRWEADGGLKISEDGLRVVATTTAGRIFTLDWARNGKLNFEKNSIFGVNVNPWYLLMDLTLIFGNAETLAQYFSSPWKFEENDGVRTLFCGNEKIEEIEFSQGEKPAGDGSKTRIRLKNFVRDYEYILTEF